VLGRGIKIYYPLLENQQDKKNWSNHPLGIMEKKHRGANFGIGRGRSHRMDEFHHLIEITWEEECTDRRWRTRRLTRDSWGRTGKERFAHPP